jgi:phosphoenolpyruvate synthase/pyruvate phosphate dikinase
MVTYVLGVKEAGRTQAAMVGGKGASLGELSRIEGMRVPGGFCVTTDAFRRILAEGPSLDDRLDQLSRLTPDDHQVIAPLSAEIRRTIEGLAIPDDMSSAITSALDRFGEDAAYAVRSSATAEDSPTASFAGQHDSYLNVSGSAAILEHVSRCWASLFTERAVTYRLRNGFDHRKVQMAVVVQQMVLPQAAGILFTADPVTSNRKVASVEAVIGLGDALVSGLVNADVYKVRGGEVFAMSLAGKRPALTDAQVVRLVHLGRRIEAHFGRPQDIEWCLVDDDFQIVQSRPITTLFPIPDAGDDENHVYLSVGHQQMMTDAMKPLGLSLHQLIAAGTMHEAGGRLFVDVAPRLASAASRPAFLRMVGNHDPLIGDALNTILERGDFIRPLPDAGASATPAAPAPIKTDLAIVDQLIARSQASVAALKRDIQGKSGAALLDFIVADVQELKRILFDPRSTQVFMAAIDATGWLNEHLRDWLGEKNAADALTQSVPNNITSEMGLALLDVADAIRPHPGVVAFLERLKRDDDGDCFLDDMVALAGGRVARDAIKAWLGKYGMRGAGEIDITRPRWSERPAILVPMILGNVRNFEPGAGARRFEQGRQAAESKQQEVLARLRASPDGEQKAEETKRMIDRVRTFIGYREYPKYGLVSRTFLYKQALMEEAERLVRSRVIREKEDAFYLTLQELHDVVRTNRTVDGVLIRQRKEAWRSYQALTPPRVLTSDGEIIAATYRRDALPLGALVGLAVSAGTVEGRARVILDVGKADLETGDILVTAYTDPSWTPLFVGIKGLVTEVGGLMTHGAVIAREYGVAAVVGVEHATELIADGQRIRVNGTDGYVEILKDRSA